MIGIKLSVGGGETIVTKTQKFFNVSWGELSKGVSRNLKKYVW